jgi:diadenosine tetraphosphate (Ap4A) HIT family hydrolase
MTEHTAFLTYRDEFLSYQHFAKFHEMTQEKARELIRKGREIEEQIQQLKTQTEHTEK